MKKKYSNLIKIICFSLFISTSIYSKPIHYNSIPQTGKTIQDFIPNGYVIHETAKGDLNKDQKEDLAIVLIHKIEKDSMATEYPPSRLLILLFKTQNGFRLAGKSNQIIRCKSCGGMYGDPFEGISIKKGILLIDHFAGSSWRWSYSYKFRFQKNDFYLIGETRKSFHITTVCDKLDDFVGTHFRDNNYLTGGYEEKKIDEEECTLLYHKKGKQKVKPLKRLSEVSE